MSGPKRRYVVIGAGAIGAVLAARIVEQERPVVLVARGANRTAIAERGLVLASPSGRRRVPIDVVGGPGEVALTETDVLVLATKTQDAESALAQWAWRPLVGSGDLAADLPVVTFQNGLAAESVALRRFARVYGASIGIAATYLRPGEVELRSANPSGVVHLGRYPGGVDSGAADLVADLVTFGYQAHAVPDIQAWKARKLLGNLANALDLLDFTQDDAERVLAAAQAEARAVFAAAQIEVASEPRPNRNLVRGRRSTWQSYARGASSEVDYLNGEIVRLGREAGVDVPVNAALQRQLGALAATRGSGVPLLQDPAVVFAALDSPSHPSRTFQTPHQRKAYL